MQEEIQKETLNQFACQQLIYRAAFLLDNAQWHDYVDCFAEEATMARPSDPDNPIVGREAILESLQTRLPRRSAHIVTNTFFSDISPESLTATSRALLLTGPADGAAPAAADDAMVVGTFVDRLVLIDGSWLFAARKGSLELKASWG